MKIPDAELNARIGDSAFSDQHMQPNRIWIIHSAMFCIAL